MSGFRFKMPCSNCMAPYTVFRKEHGCSKCAFGFCDKCCSKKALVPGLSAQPLTVCDGCYDIITGQKFISGPNLSQPKDRVDRTQGAAKPKNWWGDDRLPPPSMRRDYMMQRNHNGNNGGPNGGNKVKDNTDLESIQARFAKLKEQSLEEVKDPRVLITGRDNDGRVPTGAKVLDVLNEPTPSTSKQASDNNKTSVPTISEIEERLAALRGVPVDVIRKPRLMVMDDFEEDDDMVLPDDALQLLKDAEKNAKFAYDNPAMEHDHEGEPANRESATSLDSYTVRKIVKECEDTPSVASGISNPFPSFAETCKKVRQEAVEAERQANLFIQQSTDETGETVPPPKHVKPLESVPPGKESAAAKASPRKPGFFSKFFKSNSKENQV